jgi:adenosylhomocysteine nucleosidase
MDQGWYRRGVTGGQMSQPIAVLTAMDQEGRLIETALTNVTQQTAGGRRYVQGLLDDLPVVTVISGFGKVAAAATVATVLERFQPALVLFAGVAGGVGPNINIGDVVVAESLVQHDFDASPLFAPRVIPSLGIARIPTDPELTDRLVRAASDYLAVGPTSGASDPGRDRSESAGAALHRGLIASGDRFVDSLDEIRTLLRDLPDVLAVEMEGAAVAQICTEAATPFAVFRSISDRADENADVDFVAFVESVAAPLTAGIVGEFVANLR